MLAFRCCWAVGLLAWLAPSFALPSSVSEHEFELVLLATPSKSNGARLYDTCAACHGPLGQGSSDGSVPAIGGQHFKVLARQLVDYRHAKRWDERMTHFANLHHLKDPQEVADVASYINALAPAKQGFGQNELNEQGAEVYGRLCASCHGREAEGSSTRAVPRLSGQHYEYLLAQMHELIEGRRADYSSDHLMFHQLQQAQLADVADYLSHIDQPTP